MQPTAIYSQGCAIHVKDDGPRDGRVVMFGNSLGTDMRIWDLLLPLLPDGLRIVRFDKRGHGLSDCPPAPYSIDDLQADAVAVIETLGLRDVTYVGLSIGGLIGQSLILNRPDLLKAVVLMDSAGKTGTREFWLDRIASLRETGLEPTRDAVMERWFTEPFRSDPANIAPWANMVTRAPLEGYIGCCHAIAEADLSRAARGVEMSVPVMAMVGDEDIATPPDTVAQTAKLFGGTCHIIENAGHIPCVEQPAQVANLLAAFLDETA